MRCTLEKTQTWSNLIQEMAQIKNGEQSERREIRLRGKNLESQLMLLLENHLLRRNYQILERAQLALVSAVAYLKGLNKNRQAQAKRKAPQRKRR